MRSHSPTGDPGSSRSHWPWIDERLRERFFLHTLKFKQPFTSFFTATPRAGSKPSRFLDLLGHQAHRPRSISYARIRIQ